MNVANLLSAPVSGSIIGIAGIVIGVFVAIALYRKSTYRRKPRYAAKSAEVLADAGLASPELRIFWKDRQIENVSSVKVAFWNQGTQAIRRDDISKDEPICIRSTEKTIILSVKELSKSRETLSMETSIISDEKNGDSISASIRTDDALERNDGICYLILYTGSSKATWIVSGRVFDVPKGFKRKSLKDSPVIRIVTTIAAVVVGMLGSQLIAGNSDRNVQTITLIILTLLVTAVGATSAVFTLSFSVPKWLRKLPLGK